MKLKRWILGILVVGCMVALGGTIQVAVPVIVSTFTTGSGTIDFGSIADGTCSVATFTLTGASTTAGPGGGADLVIPAWPSTLETGLFGTMLISATDTVQVRLCNLSGSAVDPVSQAFGGAIIR